MSDRLRTDISYWQGDLSNRVLGSITEIKRNFVYLGQGISALAARAGDAIVRLDLEGLNRSAARFGKTFTLSLQGTSAGFKALTWNVLVFGITSIASMSPLLVAFGLFAITVGAASFGVAVIVSNFLGLRSILKGLTHIILGLGQISLGIIKGTAIAIGGMVKILLGFFRLLQGDVTLLWAGVDQLRKGFEVAQDAIAFGLNRIRKGLLLILDGLLTGIGQLVGVEVEQIKRQFKDLWLIFSNGVLAGDWVADKLISSLKGITISVKNTITKIGSIVRLGITALLNNIRRGFSIVFSPKDISIKKIISNLQWVFSKQGLVALGFTNPIAGINSLIKDGLDRLPNLLAAPLKYILSFVQGFSDRLKKELSPLFSSVFTSWKSKWNVFADWFKAVSQRIYQAFEVSSKALSSQFSSKIVSTIEFLQSKWNIFADWLVTTDLIPKGLESLTNLLKKAATGIENLEGKVAMLRMKLVMEGSENKFLLGVLNSIQWVLNAFAKLTNFIANLTEEIEIRWLQFTEFLSQTKSIEISWEKFSNWLPKNIEEASLIIAGTIEFLQNKWNIFAGWLVTTDLIPKGLEGLANLLKKAATGIENLEGKVAMLRMKLVMKGSENKFLLGLLTTAQTLFSWLSKISGFISKITSSLTIGWEKLSNILVDTSARTYQAAEASSAVLSSFEKIFNFLKESALSLPAAWEKIKQWWEKFDNLLWGDSSSTVEKITAAWTGFSDRVQSLLAGIVDFAKGIATKLINTLNHGPTIKIANAWSEAIAKIKETFTKLIAPAQELAEKLIAIFKGVEDNLKPLFLGIENSFSQSLESITFNIPGLNNLWSEVKKLGTEFNTLFATIKNVITQITFSDVAADAERLGLSFINLNSTGDRVGKGLGSTLDILSKGINLTANVLAGAVATAKIFVNLLTKALRFGKGLVTGVLETVTPAIENIRPALEKLEVVTQGIFNLFSISSVRLAIKLVSLANALSTH